MPSMDGNLPRDGHGFDHCACRILVPQRATGQCHMVRLHGIVVRDCRVALASRHFRSRLQVHPSQIYTLVGGQGILGR